MSWRQIQPLAVAALLAVLRGEAIAQESFLECGKGFTKTSETSRQITCLRSVTVRSEAIADSTMRRWAKRVLCSGEVVDPKSSMGQVDGQRWQVVVRFVCAGE